MQVDRIKRNQIIHDGAQKPSKARKDKSRDAMNAMNAVLNLSNRANNTMFSNANDPAV